VDPESPVGGGHVPGPLTTPGGPVSSGPIDVELPAGPIVLPVNDPVVPVDPGHDQVIPADPTVPVDLLTQPVTPAAPAEPVVVAPAAVPPADPVAPPPADPVVVPPPPPDPVVAPPASGTANPPPVRPRLPLDTPATPPSTAPVTPVAPVVQAPVTTPVFAPLAPAPAVVPAAPADSAPVSPGAPERPERIADDAGLTSLMAGPVIGRGGLLGMLALTLVDGSAGSLTGLPIFSSTGPALTTAAGLAVSGVSVVAVATARAAGHVAAGVDAVARSVRAPEEAPPVAPVDIPHAPSGITTVGASAFAPVPPPVAVAAILVLFMGLSLVRFGRVADAPARWRPVAFVSLLERPG
jgi:hypothetical protein